MDLSTTPCPTKKLRATSGTPDNRESVTAEFQKVATNRRVCVQVILELTKSGLAYGHYMQSGGWVQYPQAWYAATIAVKEPETR